MPLPARHAVLLKRTFMEYSPTHNNTIGLFGNLTKNQSFPSLKRTLN